MTRTRELPSERRPALWRRTVVRPTPPPTNLPKWFVGDWNRVIRDPLDVLRLAPLIGALVTIVLGETAHTVELLGTFLIVLAPRVLNVQRPFDLMFQLGMNLAIWGNVFSLFESIYGYDKIVHFLLACGRRCCFTWRSATCGSSRTSPRTPASTTASR
jgi:hypothetical protein